MDETVDLYLNKHKRYHSTKSNTSTSKSLSSDITEKEDLFLPTPLNHDSLLRLIDNDFEGNHSGDNDSDGNLSEDEITIS